MYRKNPSTVVPVGNITIKPGEYMTVWLRISEHPLLQYQVELRVDEREGAKPMARIFYNEEDYLKVDIFSNWISIPEVKR